MLICKAVEFGLGCCYTLLVFGASLFPGSCKFWKGIMSIAVDIAAVHMSSRNVDLSSPDVSVSLVGDGTDRLGDHMVMFLDDKVSVFAECCWTTVFIPAECATLLMVVLAYDGTDRDSNHVSWPWMTLIPLCQVDLEQLGSFRPTFACYMHKQMYIFSYSTVFSTLPLQLVDETKPSCFMCMSTIFG